MLSSRSAIPSTRTTERTREMNAPLDDARYVSLATFRRDGREVRTPVWFARLDDGYVCYSAADAGKVKRIRNNPRVRLAPCDMRGKLRGTWRDATATLLDDPATCARAFGALRARYGWQMRLVDVLARLSGRDTRRAVIALHPEGP